MKCIKQLIIQDNNKCVLSFVLIDINKNVRDSKHIPRDNTLDKKKAYKFAIICQLVTIKKEDHPAII